MASTHEICKSVAKTAELARLIMGITSSTEDINITMTNLKQALGDNKDADGILLDFHTRIMPKIESIVSDVSAIKTRIDSYKNETPQKLQDLMKSKVTVDRLKLLTHDELTTFSVYVSNTGPALAYIDTASDHLRSIISIIPFLKDYKSLDANRSIILIMGINDISNKLDKLNPPQLWRTSSEHGVEMAS
jgi:hypothetical protein